MSGNPKKKIVIGAAKAAVELKEVLKELLEEEGIEYEDVGLNSADEDVYYPSVAERAVEKIIESDYEKKGILICGTGIGMAITANKFPKIYAAQVYDSYASERASLSNDANVITLGSRITGPVLAKKIVKEWLGLEFKPGRSTPKLKEIYEIEKENFKGIE
ncbi:MAG: RpiB/LacA/LacB family sugar-phosphate isomerase [Bacillota bacterium]